MNDETVDRVFRELLTKPVSDWEVDFLRSVGTQWRRTRALSVKQHDKLQEIAKVHGVSLVEGLTISEKELWG